MSNVLLILFAFPLIKIYYISTRWWLLMKKSKDLENYTSFDSLGSYLKYVRKHFHLTMKDLAKSSGVSQPFLSLIENNKNFPSIGSLNKIVDGIDKLIELDNKEKKSLELKFSFARDRFIDEKKKNKENIEKLAKFYGGISEKDLFNNILKQNYDFANLSVNLNLLLNYKETPKVDIEENHILVQIGEEPDSYEWDQVLVYLGDNTFLTEEEIDSLKYHLLGILEKRKNGKTNKPCSQ